jgi:hypothetical protein
MRILEDLMKELMFDKSLIFVFIATNINQHMFFSVYVYKIKKRSAIMSKAKLLDQPKDFERLGVNPEKVEIWEDRRRNTDTRANNWEWWYFDAILDDGSTAVVQFFTKGGAEVKLNGDHPMITVKITSPDGTHYQGKFNTKADDAFYGENQCDVRIGTNTFKGDLREYHITVDSINEISADLVLTSMSQSYRPGTAFFTFDSDDEYYTWLCAVPKGKVNGTLTYGGKTVQVSGFGYHDHQWGSVNYLKEWNHWVWARQSFDDFSMLVFDMVSSKKTEYTRFPIVFIQDKDGNIVFENLQGVDCKVLDEYKDNEASGKDYPKSIQYTFKNNGKQVDYSLAVKDIIEAQGIKTIPLAMKLLMKTLKLNPSYSRYKADGKLKLMDGNTVVERSGELIFEFMFPGDSWKGHF